MRSKRMNLAFIVVMMMMMMIKLMLQLMWLMFVVNFRFSVRKSSFISPPMKAPVYKNQAKCVFCLCSCRFLLLWSAVLIMYPTTLAVIALTFSNYVLQPAFQNCLPPYIATRLLATICVCESKRSHVLQKVCLSICLSVR